MKNLTRQLKTLSAIEPDEHFVAATRRGILALPGSPSRRIWGALPLWATAFAMFVVSIVTATSLTRPNPALSAVENPELLSQEFNSLTINVELQGITYHQTVNQTITSALSEISSNNMRHLNQELLRSEEEHFNVLIDETDSSQIDTLLDKVIF